VTSKLIGLNGEGLGTYRRYLCIDKRVFGACDENKAFYLCEVGELSKVEFSHADHVRLLMSAC